MANFNEFSDKKMSGGANFLSSNGIVAKLGFLILVICIFVVLLKAGTRILSYIFTALL